MPLPFPQLLAAQLRSNPGRPFITWYDDATGERVELSVTTYANWVAKTANLFVDEYLLDEADTVLLTLPDHWLTPVFIGAAWQAGLALTDDPSVPHELRVVGPHDPAAADVPVIASALLPFGVRFKEELPTGVDDFGLLWPGQPDAWLGSASPDAGSVLWRTPDGELTADQLVPEVPTWQGDRLLTDQSLTEHRGAPLWEALDRSGSLVLVSRADPDGWEQRARTEHVTDVRRAAQPSDEMSPKPEPR